MANFARLKELCRDPRLQSRAGGLDDQHIADLILTLEAEKMLPPIECCRDPSGKFPFDGWHRIAAYERKGHVDIPVIWHSGGLDDAIERAAGANQKHGLKRSPADKRHAVIMLLSLKEWKNRSDRMIAEHVGVGPHLVADVRAAGEEAAAGAAGARGAWKRGREGKDGKKYKRPARTPAREDAAGTPAAAVPAVVAGPADEHQAARDALLTLAKRLDNLYTEVKDAAETLSRLATVGIKKFHGQGGVVGRIDDAAFSCKTAATNIKLAAPAVPPACTSCEGQGCRDCGGLGWQSTEERQTADNRRKASAPPRNARA